MNTSFGSGSEWTEVSSQDLPTIPTVEEMRSWEKTKVLRWIQQRDPTILEGPDLDNFSKARIAGRVFLGTSVEFFSTFCGLSPGASLGLKELVDEVKEYQPLDQPAGRKRKGGETDALVEPPISPKRNRLEESLSKLAVEARERRKRISEIITEINGPGNQLSNSVDPLPGAVDKLSDPAFDRALPFPFVDSGVPVRFKGSPGHWRYVGRTKFKQLVQTLKEVRNDEHYTTLWLYGTQGYGKSHLLAALVCYLAAQDERVVYLPDCRELLMNPVPYVQAALLFAWAEDIIIQKEITTLNTTDEIEAFIFSQRRVAKVIFVVDQMNAFKIDGPKEKEKRERVHEWVIRFTSGHKKVFSSSANDTDYLEVFNKQSMNRVLCVYGGLNRTEMNQWWERHRDIAIRPHEKSMVEDTTGCIPLLLDKCVVNGKIDLNVAELYEIYENAVAFVYDVRSRTKGDDDKWMWYCDFVKACFSHNPVPYGWKGLLHLVDHRYFYRYVYNNELHGGYTCGIARNAVASQLLLKKGVDFADTNFLLSLGCFVNSH